MAFKAAPLSAEILDFLEECSYAGLDKTKTFEIFSGFTIAFRTLTGEEEVECRTNAAEFRGPAYIYSYKTKVLSYTICELNGNKLEPQATVKVPKERIDEHGRVESILTDTPLASYLETKILSWSKGLIDICFKIWSKHQEDQIYKYMLPFAQEDLFTLEERALAKEYERLLSENTQAFSELTRDEMIVAGTSLTQASDLVQIGAQVTKQADPHLDPDQITE